MNKLWEEFLEHLHFLGIDDRNFMIFLDDRIHRYPLAWDQFGWGVLPKLDEEKRIIDFLVVVPEIVDEKTLLVNIHEYVHAHDWFQALNQIDDESKDEEYEKRAQEAEQKVLQRRTTKFNNNKMQI